MERFEYTPEDVAIFRKQIREHIVPLCQKLYEEQKERLGIEELKSEIDGLEAGATIKINDENSTLKAFNAVKDYLDKKKIAYNVSDR